MAATINYAGNTYAGEVLEDLLVYTAHGNDTFREGLIHIKPGIQKKFTLPHTSLGKIIQDNVATPTSTQGSGDASTGFNQYTHSERYLEPQDFMVYLEFNPRDYEDFWKPFQPDGQLIFRELDPKVQATMLHLLVDKKDEYLGDCIWVGKKGGVDNINITSSAVEGDPALGGDSAAGPMKYFDGFIARVLANVKANAAVEAANQPAWIKEGTTIYNGSGTAVAASSLEADTSYYTDAAHTTAAVEGTDYGLATGPTTDANVNEAATGKVIVSGNTVLDTGAKVEAALNSMWKACPKNVRKSSALKFVMSWEAWDLYDEYLTSQNYKYNENTRMNERRFKGKPIVVISGIPSSTIVLGKFNTGNDSCLWMGVDYATDQESVKVERLQANSELYFFQMRMKVDVNIVLPSEIVVHTNYKNA